MGICQFEILVYNMTHIETVENRVKRTVSRDGQPGFGETKKLNLGPNKNSTKIGNCSILLFREDICKSCGCGLPWHLVNYFTYEK